MMLRVLALGLAWLLIAAEPAHAGPVAMAIGSLVSTAWAALGTTALGLALRQTIVGLALSKISRAMQKTPPRQGAKRTVELGGDKAQPVILGRYATAGHLIYEATHGKVAGVHNAFWTGVHLVSVLPGVTLRRVNINGQWCPLGETAHPDYGFPVLEYRDDGEDFLWVKWYSGSQTAADPMLRAKYGSAEVWPWLDDMVGRGTAYAILTMRHHAERLTSPPKHLYEVDGIPLYNRRLDTTAGGAGPQRRNDPATWAQSLNPIVAAETILGPGLSYDGTHLWGPRWPLSAFPPAQWSAAISACDVEVGGTQGPQPMARFGCEIELDTQPMDVVRELLKSGFAETAICEGQALIHAGPAGAPVMHITDADWSIDDPQELDPFKGLEKVFNATASTFPDPEQAWTNQPAPPRYNPAWEAEDGERRAARLQWPYAPFVDQVQRLDTVYLADSRKQRIHRGVLKPNRAGIAPLDRIQWTSARNFYSAKLFKVMAVEDLPGGWVHVVLIEEDPDDYDPPAYLPWTPPAITVPALPPLLVPGLVVEPVIIQNAGGTNRRPGVRIRWDASDLDGVTAITWYMRLAGSLDAVPGPLVPVEAGQYIVEVLAATDYEVSVSPVARGLPVGASAWIAVTSPDIRFGAEDFEADVRAKLSVMQDWADAGLEGLPEFLADLASGQRGLSDTIRALAAEAASGFVHDQTQRAALSREISVEIGNTRAGFKEDVQVLADADAALAQQIVTLTASAGANASQIAQMAQTMATQYSAIGTMISGIETTLGGKANSSVVTALDGRVTTAEGAITSQGSMIDAINLTIADPATGLPGKASAGGLVALTGTVSDLNGVVTAQATSLSELFASASPGVVNQARIKMEVVSGPSGWTRIAIMGRASGSGTWRQAGIYIDVPNSGVSSEIVVQSDKFSLIDGAGKKAPFIVSGGQIYFNAAMVNLTSSTVVDPTFRIGPATGQRFECTPKGFKLVGPDNTIYGEFGLP